VKFVKLKFITLLSRILYRRYPNDAEFQNFEYEVHPVCPEYSGSKNFRILAFEGEEHKFCLTRYVIDGFFFSPNHVF
jgi:hypothetical protein